MLYIDCIMFSAAAAAAACNDDGAFVLRMNSSSWFA